MSTPLVTPVRQQAAIMNTKQLLAYIKPLSHHTYWKVMAKDPRFPKPIMGGAGSKALHSVELIDAYLREVARTGFLQEGEPIATRAGQIPASVSTDTKASTMSANVLHIRVRPVCTA